MNNISYSEKYVASNISDSIVNMFWYWLRSVFRKVQWLHFIGEVDTFTIV